MQIQSFAIPVPRTDSGSSSGGTSTQDTNDMFMQLLTAQLKNQSPLNPVDPMQFTSQLVQFNMLDQLTQIKALMQAATKSSTSTHGESSQSIPGAR